MKRYLFLVFCSIMSLSVFAYDFQIGDLCYTITSTSEHTVSVEASSKDLRGDVVIPSIVTYNNVDFTVTEIAIQGFAHCYYITSFTIPNTVKGIGRLGFGWCWYLNTIILDNPGSSFDEGDSAFNYDWRDFKTVRIVNIDEKELMNNGAGFMASQSLPAHDLYINEKKVVDYKVVEGVETINNCFRKCNSIETLSIPNSVKAIVKSACFGCTALKTITLSSRLESIGYSAFDECPELRTIYAKSITPPAIDNSTFPNGAYMFATLYVPKGTLSSYKNAKVWENFANIVETEYDDVTDVPQPTKCSTPNISYQDGKIIFTCETEGAECISTISDTDINTHHGNEVSLSATYTISVYAKASGHEDSDVAVATLCWIDVEPKTEGLTNDITKTRGDAVLIQAYGGTLNISGVKKGADIVVYSTTGVKVGSVKACSSLTSIATCLRSGEIAIVNIDGRSVKVVMK